MTTNELNDFIKHYIEKNKTRSAIMLSAPWGTGKSYYIQNSLIPFLAKDNFRKCIVVSLYGLNDIKDISKSIFLESKAKILNNNSTGMASTKLIGKTVVKGIASFFGVDLSLDEGSLNKLYESIDLSDKLIILEDLERANISIIETLGYVNNLVEQDGVKVLLVANESEILKYTSFPVKNADGKETIKTALSEESKIYIKTKEKTVSDTIDFYSSNTQAIDNILMSFNNKYFDKLLEDKEPYSIDSMLSWEIEQNIMFSKDINSQNLRSLIFACQKTSDILDKMDFVPNISFVKSVLMSNIAFALRKAKTNTLSWSNDENSSHELGTYKFPLYRFSYDYIISQHMDTQEIEKSNQIFCNREEFEKNQKELNSHLNVLYRYYEETEKNVVESLKYISEKLENNSAIPFSEYGGLVNYLISIKDSVGYDDIIDHCKTQMLNNLTETDLETLDRITFHSGIQLESKSSIDEFNMFMKEMENKLKACNSNLLDFDYTPGKIDEFYSNVLINKATFLSKGSFAKKIDNDRLIELIRTCDSRRISNIRGIYMGIYRSVNINEFLKDDRDSLIDLKNKIDYLINETESTFDKIQMKQINWFSNNLQEIIEKL